MHDLWASLVCPSLASDMGRLFPPAALPPWWEEERQGGAPQGEVHAVYVRSHFGSEVLEWTTVRGTEQRDLADKSISFK